MSTEPQRTCPSCGNELSGAMEFCPVCMPRKGIASGVESSESSDSENTVKLATPEQVVQRFEHYELVLGGDGKPVELGRGAMGVTYKAFDVDLHCPVTLKGVRDESSQVLDHMMVMILPTIGNFRLLDHNCPYFRRLPFICLLGYIPMIFVGNKSLREAS